MADFEGLAALRALARKLGCLTCLTSEHVSGDTQGVENDRVSAVSPVSLKNSDALQPATEMCADPETEYCLAERAAILQFEGGLTRADAEWLARVQAAEIASGVDMGSI